MNVEVDITPTQLMAEVSEWMTANGLEVPIFYYQDEWENRDEIIGNGAALSFITESTFSRIQNYESDGELAQAWEKACEAWQEKGYSWSQGFAWSWHFYTNEDDI